MKVIIEHCESILSKWLWFEYSNCSKIVGKNNLIFTNVREDEISNKLSRLGIVFNESIISLVNRGAFNCNEIIILDLEATTPLSPLDFKGNTKVVIGGILGDHPPKGKTYKLITSRLPNCVWRNLGPYQFSIDGAAYVALQVSLGRSLDEIPIALGFKIKVNEFHEIYLPYAFPIVDDKPLVSQDLIEYLKSNEIVEDELKLIQSSLHEA